MAAMGQERREPRFLRNPLGYLGAGVLCLLVSAACFLFWMFISFICFIVWGLAVGGVSSEPASPCGPGYSHCLVSGYVAIFGPLLIGAMTAPIAAVLALRRFAIFPSSEQVRYAALVTCIYVMCVTALHWRNLFFWL
jgi:hypothetical protein